MHEKFVGAFEPTDSPEPEAADLVPMLAALVGEVAAQVDELTGLVKGQDSEGWWMSQELGRLAKAVKG